MKRAVLLAGLVAGLFYAQADASAAGLRDFFSPQLDGERFAFCSESGEHCGKAVADAFCRFQGYDEALLFQREEMTAEALPILYADTGERCAGESCVGFRLIKCRGR